MIFRKYPYTNLNCKFAKSFVMEELVFIIEECLEGGFVAKGLGVSIYTQADNYENLKLAIIDAVHCHFEDDKKRIIRLHIVKEEVIAA